MSKSSITKDNGDIQPTQEESYWKPCELCGKELENPNPFGSYWDECDCPASDAKRAEAAARVKKAQEDIERLGIEGFRKMVAERQGKPSTPPAQPLPHQRVEDAITRMRRENQDKQRKGQLSEYLTLLTEIEGMAGLNAAYVRSDGVALIPEGKVSSIIGDVSTCKTWILLDIARWIAGRGGRVLWWDFEDSKETLLDRCAAIGFGPDEGLGNVGFVPPALADEPGLVQQAALWVRQGDVPGLVVIDALSSAGCPSDGSDISPWWDTHVTPFGTSQTMVLGDHRPKRAEDRAPGGIGSVHKRSFLTGVLLLADGVPWTKEDDGRISLVNQKDRHSILPNGLYKPVASVVGKHVDSVLVITVEPPTDRERGADLRERIVNALTLSEPAGIRTTKTLAEKVGCKKAALTGPLLKLVEDDVVEKVLDGKADVYRIARGDTPF